jgi:phage repressor protein C with HTH and peptisase S24 domain
VYSSHGGKEYDFRTLVKEQKYDERIMMSWDGVVYGMRMSSDTLNDKLTAWLVRGLMKPGKKNTELARLLGIPQPRVAEMKAGKRLIKTTEVAIIADYIGEPVPIEVLPQQPLQQVPVVGYVGAGAEIFSVDDHAKGGGIDYVDAPPGGISKSAVALVVRGDSMLPVFEAGDIIYYDRQDNGDLSHLIGKNCVVRLADGRTFVKKLQFSNGAYWLHSHNADPIVDAQIEWAARVLWVKKA